MDDLVQRLRQLDRGWPTLLSSAADRIEQLESDRDKWRNECLDANDSERKLFQRQAELEAEVERLRKQSQFDWVEILRLQSEVRTLRR